MKIFQQGLPSALINDKPLVRGEVDEEWKQDGLFQICTCAVSEYLEKQSNSLKKLFVRLLLLLVEFKVLERSCCSHYREKEEKYS